MDGNPSPASNLRNRRLSASEMDEPGLKISADTALESGEPSSKLLAVRPTSLFGGQVSRLRGSAREISQASQSSFSSRHNSARMTPNQSNSISAMQQPVSASQEEHFSHHHHQSINTTTSSNSQQTAISISESSNNNNNKHRQQDELELELDQDPRNPYPLYAPITFFYLNQTARPRSWCLAIVSNKYPLHLTPGSGPPCGSIDAKSLDVWVAKVSSFAFGSV